MENSINSFINYWNKIDSVLVEKHLDPETTVGGHRIHRFVESINREDNYPCFSKDLAKFRIKDIHDDAVYYAKLYDVIDEYPFSDNEYIDFIGKIVDMKGVKEQ